jgi:tRNA 5-methylaminomethyl-2-thiouridine biosynthesis bifunctional protein
VNTPLAGNQIVIVGAGLAGAAAAESLARRGWQVCVVDAAPAPAAGASALPVGLFLPHVSHDDNPRSKLSRAGVRLTLQAIKRLLVNGADFDAGGVAELAIDRARRLPDTWPESGRQWSDGSLPASIAEHLHRIGAPLNKAHWHASAGWIKPARLVQALLNQAGIRFQGSASVQQITWSQGQWQLHGPQGEPLAQAPHLLIASAGDAPRLVALAALAKPGIPSLAPLTALRGQVSWARHTASDAALFAPCPVNGAGSVIAHVPQGGGTAWYAGATYETPDMPQAAIDSGHTHNQGQMARLLPAADVVFTQARQAARIESWQGTRWATADRLPLVGALHAGDQPGLWLSTAMGSRGLTFAVLCAEVLAAQMGGEPAPLPKRLLRLIAADRPR